MGHGRGPRPRTYKAQSVSGEPENQPKFVLLLWFYSHPRLTPFGLFALFLEEMCEMWKPTGRGNHRCASELAIFPRGNVGKLETAKLLSPLRGRVQPRGAPQKLHFHMGKRGRMGNREVAGIIVELRTSQQAQKAPAKAQDAWKT